MSTDATAARKGLSREQMWFHILHERIVLTVRWPRLALSIIWLFALVCCFLDQKLVEYLVCFSFLSIVGKLGVIYTSGTIGPIRTLPLSRDDLHRLLWLEEVFVNPLIAWVCWLPIWICAVFRFGQWSDPFVPWKTFVLFLSAAGFMSVASLVNNVAFAKMLSNPNSMKQQFKGLGIFATMPVFFVLAVLALGIDLYPLRNVLDGVKTPPPYIIWAGYLCALLTWTRRESLVAPPRVVPQLTVGFDGYGKNRNIASTRRRDPVYSIVLMSGIGFGFVLLPIAYFYRGSDEKSFVIVLVYMFSIIALAATAIAGMMTLRVRRTLPISIDGLASILTVAPALASICSFLLAGAISVAVGANSVSPLIPGPALLGFGLIACALTLRYGIRRAWFASFLTIMFGAQAAAIVGLSSESVQKFAATYGQYLAICSIAIFFVSLYLAFCLNRRFLNNSSAYRNIEREIRALFQRYRQAS